VVCDPGATYVGVRIFVLRSSSNDNRIPFSLNSASRENKTSVGICKREFVAVKTFRSELFRPTGKLRKKKMQIEKNSTFKAREVSVFNGRAGGRVR